MENSVASALELMLIGMITVFAVLSLVVITGNVLIRLVNRFASAPAAPPAPPVSGGGTNPKTVAALAATVAAITRGKGQIERIERKD